MDNKERATRLRELVGKTNIEKLAEKAGLGQNTIRNAISKDGSNMTVETLRKLADVLGVHPSGLV